MTLLAPLGLLAGLLAGPVIAMHVLRSQRERVEVSSTMLWRRLDTPVAPVRPWQRLRWSLPLVLQLLLVALLALALSRPAFSTEATLAEHTVFVVDTSGSMLAGDERPDRTSAAVERVRSMLDELPDGGAVSIVVAAADPELELLAATDARAIERTLDAIRPSSGVADFVEAFSLAEAAITADRPTGFVLVSDGGVHPDDQRLAPPGMRYESVGRSDVNRAITQLSVTTVDGELRALVTIVNTGGPASEQPLRVDVDGATVHRETLELAAGATVERSIPIPPGSRVEAFLDGDDLLPNDNQRAALIPLATDLRVRVATADPAGAFFVEEVLAAIGAQIVGPFDEPDLVVYDRVRIPADTDTPFISIAAPRPPPGIDVTGVLERPVPTFVEDDVILRDVDVSSTAIAAAQDLEVDAGEVLIAGAEGEPLLVEGRTGDVRWYHLAFELEQSNLPVEVAYPILFSRMVSDLTITDDVPASAVLGTRLPGIDDTVQVTSPRGRSMVVAPGSPMPVLDDAGFWTVESSDGELRPVAVVFPSDESSLAVANDLPNLPPVDEADVVGDDPEQRRSTAGAVGFDDLVPWFLIAALVALAAESFASRRTRAPPRQRVAAVVARVAVFALLIGALVDLDWRRDGTEVRTVVVADVSDSLGAEGRRAVDEFVEQAAGSGDVAVVEVGSTARVSRPFDARTAISGSAPGGEGTDLVRGLRLASSLLDDSTRQRIVVVSDGRATSGDVSDEFQRLARLGITVDSHTIAIAEVDDVAVEALRGPSTVSEDEAYRLVADVVTNEDATTTVSLFRYGEVVETKSVSLEAGTNEVVFDVQAGDERLVNYEVRLSRADDQVPQNDAATTVVTTAGPPSVLVVDGHDGAGDEIADALIARSVEVSRSDVMSLPARDDLISFGTVVLVDVDAGDLNDEHLTALEVSVRELGNGLVVVGGSSSFALGGYAESRLEQLLPVESRAEDPTRKATVSQVLLIDASESMGACHCAPLEGQAVDDPFAGEAIEGGVNKTDISRTAAARAIDALSDGDEVGVLAFNGRREWVVALQPVSGADTSGLDRLRPTGETFIAPALTDAADALRGSDKELKHIILFSDGFSPELMSPEFAGGFEDQPGYTTLGQLTQQVEEMADDGITVSVVGTGEGAAPLLEGLAEAGNGRFYPGRDLDEIPEIFVEEARLATRSFINEGVFVPLVSSTAAPVRQLSEAPAVTGYVASTPKPTADVMLQVGEFADPLLSSWRVGLGRVTAWTSDGGGRWSADWASWSGWADFWSAVVRDTFRLDGASGQRVTADLRGESMVVTLESEDPIPAGSTPVARVARPDGSVTEAELRRIDATHFEAAVQAADTGSHAATVILRDEPNADESAGAADRTSVGTGVGTASVSRSYPIEYRPSIVAADLAGLSESLGGRGDIAATAVLDPDGLAPGSKVTSLQWALLLAATLLFPLALALQRIRFSTLREDLRRSRAERHERRRSHPPRSRRHHRPTPTPSPDAS